MKTRYLFHLIALLIVVLLLAACLPTETETAAARTTDATTVETERQTGLANFYAQKARAEDAYAARWTEMGRYYEQLAGRPTSNEVQSQRLQGLADYYAEQGLLNEVTSTEATP